MSTISIVVPVYNREKLIERCLNSILNQETQPSELIVVDNNSTDSSYEVVKKWMDSHPETGVDLKLLREEEQGACVARQKGLENAHGDYVLFFDSDDAMRPGLLSRVKEELNKTPESDIICWKCQIHQLDGSFRVPPFAMSNPLEMHLIHTLLRPQGYIVRKEFLLKAGGWKKPVEVWNDYELGLRLLIRNPVIKGINEILADIYSQEDSITGVDFSTKEGKWEKTLREMENVIEETDQGEKERIKRIINYRKVILAAHYHREGNRKGAEKLKREALQGSSLKEEIILRFVYNYTSRGFRGAWRIVRFAY